MHWKHSVTNEEPAILAHFCQNYEWAADYCSEQYYRALFNMNETEMDAWSQRYVKLAGIQSDIAFTLLRLKLIQMDLNMSPDIDGELRILWQRGK